MNQARALVLTGPDELRARVNLAYARRERDPTSHRQAVHDAHLWYRKAR